MANFRIARFMLEVAPPQYVTVMRHRTTKMLDTISEEEREISPNDYVNSPTKISPASAKASSPSPAASASAPPTTIASNTKHFLKEFHRSLSVLNHRST